MTAAEVKQAVFDIDEDKAPGPHGFSLGFYKAAWPIVGPQVTEAILDFFAMGKMLKQINTMLLALIPKSMSNVRRVFSTLELASATFERIPTRHRVPLRSPIRDVHTHRGSRHSRLSILNTISEHVDAFLNDKEHPRCTSALRSSACARNAHIMPNAHLVHPRRTPSSWPPSMPHPSRTTS
ncbi:UNVERIFIED_CONTAM: hypothetical protein Sindi_2261400 [Sesamum indicum]